MSLAEKTCIPCREGAPRLALAEVRDYMKDAPGWEANEDATRITRTFTFADFANAQVLAKAIGALCEDEGHHAELTVGWGYCRVMFQTHKIRGLHENDFIMAAKVDRLADG